MKIENYKIIELYTAIKNIQNSRELSVTSIMSLVALQKVLEDTAVKTYLDTRKIITTNHTITDQEGKTAIGDEFKFNEDINVLNMELVEIYLPDKYNITQPKDSKVFDVPTVKAFVNIRGDNFGLSEV